MNNNNIDNIIDNMEFELKVVMEVKQEAGSYYTQLSRLLCRFDCMYCVRGSHMSSKIVVGC